MVIIITSAGNTVVLSAVVSASLDSISIVALKKASGEYFRKAYDSRTQLSSTKYQYTFYITEAEGNDIITGIGLCGNGATTTLNSGTTYATQDLSLVKTSTQSLKIIWTVSLV